MQKRSILVDLSTQGKAVEELQFQSWGACECAARICLVNFVDFQEWKHVLNVGAPGTSTFGFMDFILVMAVIRDIEDETWCPFFFLAIALL